MPDWLILNLISCPLIKLLFMKAKFHFLILISVVSSACSEHSDAQEKSGSNVRFVGAMRDVMWKGKLGGTIDLDTIQNRKGLYGLGPVEYLQGELLIMDGIGFRSTVMGDSAMKVEKTFKAKAPFFVYANETEWEELSLPARIKSISDLEKYINTGSKNLYRPFVFKLSGVVESAVIHIQNLPEGTKVSSPEEAHTGQVNYAISNSQVDIIGFFSTEHAGVFTHHDSNVHLHLITADKKQMGHLEEVEFKKGAIKLFLPKQ